jgi:N-acetyl-anhydromuramyl-L-alanine amidase AmpD
MLKRAYQTIPVVLAFTLGACSSDKALAPCPDLALGASLQRMSTQGIGVLPPSEFDPWFRSASRAHGVDAALLKAVAWTETRLHMVVGHGEGSTHDHHGQPEAWGVMALRGERLERAAALAGLDPEEVRRDPEANVLAAAALLAFEARAVGVADHGPEAWGPALERFSGIDLPAARSAYADAAVLPAMQRAGAVGNAAAATSSAAGAGASTSVSASAAAVAHSHCPAVQPVPVDSTPVVRTIWRASPNFNSRMAGDGGQIAVVIIHTCEGSYSGCWGWLSNPASSVSAHYVVNEEGTEITHLVQEPMRAWHIGASYDCTLNRDRRCDLNGVQSNHFTVGIEHAGYAAWTSFPPRQTDVSAKLVCEITKRHGSPRDWQHIVAHGQLQPWNRTDPGPNWPWVRYVALVQRHCGEVVVDDDMAFNDADFARVSSSALWSLSDSTRGYYGRGYRWAPTHPELDEPLVFQFFVDTAGTRQVEARWTAGSNRAPAAQFTVRDSSGAVLATVERDQRAHHDEWRPLATLTLAAGWHRVELSRRGETGSVVVADAIRVR